MAIDILTLKVVPSDEAVKKEVVFKLNAFKTTDSFSDYAALAMKIKDLLLMEPGTHPGAVDMGVGIRNYLMEIADSTTIQALTSDTETQIRKFIPTTAIKRVEYMINLQESDRNKLYLIVHINKEDSGETGYFGIGISKSSNTLKTSDVLVDLYL